ncbi:diguanylate cyclase (GGDEF)-like protein [Natronospira proteinivora]|uniref:Diguanylate cyclase (GGDEF)-like protein n=1 Tax=Natronospira proteinivora TaxID=1807133 RepID=A0ABT1G4L0_9GAMM|nr:EAL domain-containing protein [Natronospira proteinivora]MCP1726234.1 diguanylate cyclase (GGDEF)-like protein [Natronospira proteinivora]
MLTGQLMVTDRDVDSQVRAEMIKRLFTYCFPSHIVCIPAAVLIAILVSAVVSWNVALGWALALIISELGRLVACLFFFRSRGHVNNSGIWFAIFLTGALVSGAIWGSAGVLLFPEGQPEYQIIMALILVAIAGIGLPLLAPAFWLYMVIMVLILAPISLMLLLNSSSLTQIAAVLIGLSALVLVLAARRLNWDQTESVAARHSFASAAESLRQEVDERRRIETELRRRETTNQRRKLILMELARHSVIAEGDLAQALREVSQSVARGLGVTRISVWFLSQENAQFDCRLILDGDRVDNAPNLNLDIRIDRADREEFERLRTLVVPDVKNHAHAGRYWDDYFRSTGIHSILAAPFRRDGRVRGFLMAESRIQRFWTEDDDSFISSAVDFISLAMAASDRRKAQHRLREMATLDGLTRLPNRNAFHEFIGQSIKSAAEEGNRLGLLFVDLDRFKAVNDSLGHHAGDIVLQEMSQRLLDSLRDGDWVARLAGDEFTVIVHDLESLETLRGIANRVRKSLIQPMVLDNTEITLTCSIGIAIYPDDAEDPERLLQSADAAMYEAKKQGRNRYAFFTPELRERAVRRLSLDNELRRAVEDNEFLLHYQPIVRPETGTMVGVEALVRWQRSDGRMISPGEFIPLAEETGLVVPIGEWVLNEALMQLGEWDRDHHGGLTMSVNFSMVQCRHGGLPAMVDRALNRSGIDSARLVAEVTESDVLVGQQQYQAVFDRLRERGVRVAMDDFGTGSSSLGQLKRLPVDILKLDRSFVRDITKSSQDEAITRAAITMADALGLNVIAEGVEEATQRDLLIDAGCRLMQGFYFSRPRPAEEIEGLLREKRNLPES